jgi:hypothetical protein
MHLGRTPALGELRTQLAQTQRELVTLLIGLDAIRAGRAGRVDGTGPRAPWRDDSDREQSVRHARRFVCDAALGRIVDALDGYLAALRRVEALAAGTPKFAALPERSVKARLDALSEDLDASLHSGAAAECRLELALAHLAIQWRNRRLHSGAANRLEQRHVAALRASASDASAGYDGVRAGALLEHFDASRSPRLREIAGLARAVSALGARLDRAAVAVAVPERYAEEALARAFCESGPEGARRLAELWGRPPEKRLAKLRQVLKTLGFRDEPVTEGQPALADGWLDDLAAGGYREAAARLGLVEERAAPRDGDS